MRSMSYIDAQENLKTRGVMGLWIEESEQFNAAENVIRVNWWPCQTAAATAAIASVCEYILSQGHKGDGVMTMKGVAGRYRRG